LTSLSAGGSRLNDLFAKYQGRVAFYAVYIREAHTSDVWQDPDNLDDKVIFAKPKSYDERVEMGQLCVVKLGIKFPRSSTPSTTPPSAPTPAGPTAST